ncbi:hypothetical protein [Dactylosporangium sp. CA-092794]|uniref:hypothetical protein n=1 Tax=Dactylosporangium sp. CA-092794 TaxID=3239929 RepID=UPI003D8E568C
MTGLDSYASWRDVPSHLLSATLLGELEFPRKPDPAARAALVHTRDWSDHDTTVTLFDARRCPPTGASAGQLAAAAARATRSRVCADCAAWCQRLLPVDLDGRPLCPACRSVLLLRRAQAQAADDRAAAAAQLHTALHWPDVAVLQVDVTTPERTPGLRKIRTGINAKDDLADGAAAAR